MKMGGKRKRSPRVQFSLLVARIELVVVVAWELTRSLQECMVEASAYENLKNYALVQEEVVPR